jgi:HEAT repeat protein
MPPALSRRRLLAACALVAACVLGAGLFALGRPGASSPPPAPQDAPAPVTLVQSSDRAYRPGTVYRYALTTEQWVKVTSPQPGAEVPPSMHFRMNGEWRVGVCDERAEGIDARITFAPTDVFVDVDETPMALEAENDLRAGLSIPFFITLDRAGSVRWIHFERDIDVFAQGLLRSVVALSQVVLPSTGRDAWEVSEQDGSGRYKVDYRMKPRLYLEKRKLRYTHLVLDDVEQPLDGDFTVDVTSTKVHMTLDPEDLWLRSLEASESVKVIPGADMPAADGHTRVDLRLLGRGSELSLPKAFAARQSSLLSQSLSSPPRAGEPDPDAQHRKVLAGRTFTDFTKLLSELPEDAKARGEAISAALAGLIALFRVEPAAAAEVHAWLRTAPAPDAVATILGALSGVASRETLHALSQVMVDTQLPIELRARAAEAASESRAPTEEAVASLWKLARGPETALHSFAVLGLGTAAARMHELDAPAADALVDELTRASETARGEEAQDLWLIALGNTRSPRALPAIRRFLTNPSAILRASATNGLRFMPAPEADRLLSERLASDSDATVRMAAVRAAGFRPLDPLFAAIEHALRTDKETLVRKDLVDLLRAQTALSAEMRGLLAWSSEEDPDEGVRKEAAKALANPPRP